MKKMAPLIVCALCTLIFSGCATQYPPDPNDPYQNYNRAMYRFNDDFYKNVADPINTAYVSVVPDFARIGVSNFFQNAGTAPAMANDVLQWNWRYFAKDTVRLVLNTTLGLFGLIDVAGNAGVPAHAQGFSYTLSKWGWTNSNYFIMPFFGPGTVSTAISLPVNYFMSPITYIPNNATVSWSLWGLNSVQTISNGLPSYNTVNATAIDPYVAIRDAYMQNHAFIIEQIQTDGLVATSPDDNSQMSPIFLQTMSS